MSHSCVPQWFDFQRTSFVSLDIVWFLWHHFRSQGYASTLVLQFFNCVSRSQWNSCRSNRHQLDLNFIILGRFCDVNLMKDRTHCRATSGLMILVVLYVLLVVHCHLPHYSSRSISPINSTCIRPFIKQKLSGNNTIKHEIHSCWNSTKTSKYITIFNEKFWKACMKWKHDNNFLIKLICSYELHNNAPT